MVQEPSGQGTQSEEGTRNGTTTGEGGRGTEEGEGRDIRDSNPGSKSESEGHESGHPIQVRWDSNPGIQTESDGIRIRAFKPSPPFPLSSPTPPPAPLPPPAPILRPPPIRMPIMALPPLLPWKATDAPRTHII